MSTNLAIKPSNIAEHVHADLHPSVLAEIYKQSCNLASWQRPLSEALTQDIKELLANKTLFNYRMVITPQEIQPWLNNEWSGISCSALIEDIENLVTLFVDLFQVEKVGLRLELVNKTVCPYFHVDKVVSRLVTTYHGPATEWLAETNTNRNALKNRQYGAIIRDEANLQHANVGEVMIFKGESWQDQHIEPIVHRSPPCPSHQRRLLLTLDML
jgi:hypothetical protein